MSYDELPPDAKSPQQEDADASLPAQDPSSQDAPPAATSRRRASVTGSDAASSPSTSETTAPARSSRRRSVAPAADGPDALASTSEAGADLSTPLSDSTSDPITGPLAPSPAPSGRRRRVSKTEAGAAKSESETLSDDGSTVAPTSKHRTRRTKIGPDEEAQPIGQNAEDVAAVSPTLHSEAEVTISPADDTAAEPTPPRASRRRSARIRKSSSSDEPSDAVSNNLLEPSLEKSSEQSLEQSQETEIPGETPDDVSPDIPTIISSEVRSEPDETSDELLSEDSEADSDLEAEEAAVEPVSRSSRRRRRTSRSKAQQATPDSAQAGKLAAESVMDVDTAGEARTGEIQSEDTEEKDSEADETDEASKEETTPGESRSKRRRGGRRGGRSRREPRPDIVATLPEEQIAADEEAVVASAPIIDVTAVPFIEPVIEVVEVVEEPIDLNVGAHLITLQGRPVIHINGVAYPPVLFFGNAEGAKNSQRVFSEVRRAARAGVRLHSVLIELPCPLTEATSALDEIDNRLRGMLEADPAGYVMPRIVFLPARGWKREYPTEIAAYADGTTGDPSLTSERFWKECERALQSLITHISTQHWGDRIFGYHLERGEWFQPMDQGYDRSTANRDAFRDWLRDKYKNSLVALRAAWYDGDVQFHTADIPPVPGKPNQQRAFYETRRERKTIDFYEFTSESTAKRLITLARTIKQAANNNALVSLCYGYTFEFGHGFSGHLALEMLLGEKSIDLISGPPSYRDRKPGGGASFPAPVGALALHGKLWISEDDTKTYLAPTQQTPDDFNPRLGDRFQTEQAQVRAMGKALVHNAGIDWMDLWGEGWLDDDAMWERIGAFTSILKAQQQISQPSRTPDMVALIDEKSLLHIQRGEPFFRRMTNGLRDTLQRVGVSFDTYLQSDLLSPDFPTNAKVYLFLTPFRLTSAHRNAIKEKLQRDNKTLVWLYAPNSCEERASIGGAMEETATGTIGLTLRQQAWNSEIGSRIIESHHPVTERLNGRDIGPRERLNPSFYVDDPDALLLAEYHGSGLPSLAVKNLGTWKSVFVGDPVLPLEMLRGICRYADVHLWTTGGEDVVCIGNGWVTVHAARDGQRTLRLPKPSALYDFMDQRLIADEAREYRFFMKLGNTRVFYAGSVEEMQRLGLPNTSELNPRRERVVLPGYAEPLPEIVAPAVPVVLNSDVETLRAVLAMKMPEFETSELEREDVTDDEALDNEDDEDEGDSENSSVASETTELSAKTGSVSGPNKRRRRRGGRGRGRRRTEFGTEAATPSETIPTETLLIEDRKISSDIIASDMIESLIIADSIAASVVEPVTAPTPDFEDTFLIDAPETAAITVMDAEDFLSSEGSTDHGTESILETIELESIEANIQETAEENAEENRVEITAEIAHEMIEEIATEFANEIIEEITTEFANEIIEEVTAEITQEIIEEIDAANVEDIISDIKDHIEDNGEPVLDTPVEVAMIIDVEIVLSDHSEAEHKDKIDEKVDYEEVDRNE